MYLHDHIILIDTHCQQLILDAMKGNPMGRVLYALEATNQKLILAHIIRYWLVTPHKLDASFRAFIRETWDASAESNTLRNGYHSDLAANLP